MPDKIPVRILIVDDEAAQMKALCDTLQDHGFDTVGFTSSPRALEELSHQRFDLILTDLMMPEMDGLTFLRAALILDPDLAGVVMTGQGSISTAVEAMQSGAMDYIQKPFKVSTALPVLARSLTLRRLRIENTELLRRDQERIEELELKNRELASFSSAVSHDLRTPLRAINITAFTLETECGHLVNAVGREAIENLKIVTKRMDALIEDLLKLARVTEAEMLLGNIDISHIAEVVVAELQSAEPDRSVDFDIQSGLEAYGDERLIAVALSNLLGNAWKFTSKVERPRISVGRDPGQQDSPFFIRDNGAGFQPEFATKLFKPFERLHSPTDFPGTGIGLATVRRVVERHGGRVWAEGVLGRGATFLFALPEGPAAGLATLR